MRFLVNKRTFTSRRRRVSATVYGWLADRRGRIVGATFVGARPHLPEAAFVVVAEALMDIIERAQIEGVL